MRRAKPLVLSAGDRAVLEKLVAQPTARAGHARRARVVLLAEQGVSGEEIARRLDLTRWQVSRIRRRFRESGVAGLADQPKAGRGNNVAPFRVRQILETVMKAPPQGHSHWSVREVARQVGLSPSVVHKILRANDLKPHLQSTFKVSKDPDFAEKVKDVVGLYLNPPERAVVICLDEKTQVQALERSQPMLPLKPGQIERRTHDYKRHGVVDLYAALEVATGRVVADCRPSHTNADFLAFLNRVKRQYPRRLLHLVLDNSSSHKTAEVRSWLEKNPRVSFHFTPTSASWLNQVEGFFSILTRRSLRRTSFPSKAALIRHLQDFLARWND